MNEKKRKTCIQRAAIGESAVYKASSMCIREVLPAKV